jgi:pimeloyl-ACP methyl ester carboxylesterase
MPLEMLSHAPSRPSGKAPLLFVHGAWHGAWCWEKRFLPYFAERGYEAHAPSLRAHGGNDRTGIHWKRIADYVDDVAEVAARLSRPPVLIGHSMGGLLVQKYLERGSVPAAVLLASVPTGGIFGVTRRLAMRHPLLFLEANATWSLYPYVRTPELAREAFLSLDMPADEATVLWEQMQEESYVAFLDMLLFPYAPPRLADGARTPMLVLGAADDRTFTVSEVRRTAAAYGLEAEIFPEMAHDMMLERGWRAVADRILAWLDERGL